MKPTGNSALFRWLNWLNDRNERIRDIVKELEIRKSMVQSTKAGAPALSVKGIDVADVGKEFFDAVEKLILELCMTDHWAL